MNTPTRTIWMNVTTSEDWQRPPVGIVRVERSLSIELAKIYGARLRQCIWQGHQFIAWAPEAKKRHSRTQLRQSFSRLSKKLKMICQQFSPFYLSDKP